MILTLVVVSGKNTLYIGDGYWEECSLRWWLVGRTFLTMVFSGKNVLYINGQWEDYLLHWWSLGTMLLGGKNVPYIGGE